MIDNSIMPIADHTAWQYKKLNGKEKGGALEWWE